MSCGNEHIPHHTTCHQPCVSKEYGTPQRFPHVEDIRMQTPYLERNNNVYACDDHMITIS